MKITDNTPKPVERTFTIELTENELKNITLIVGQCIPLNIRGIIESNHWSSEVLGGMTYIHPNNFYDTLKDAILNK